MGSPVNMAAYVQLDAAIPNYFLQESGSDALNEIVAAHLDEAAERGEMDLAALGRDVAAALFVNLVRGELQLQCLTHPGSIPSAAQRDLWARAAVTTFVRAYGKRAGRSRAQG